MHKYFVCQLYEKPFFPTHGKTGGYHMYRFHTTIVTLYIRFRHANWLLFMTRSTHDRFINSAASHLKGLAEREMCKDVKISLLGYLYTKGKYRELSPGLKGALLGEVTTSTRIRLS